tara:strand:+ start:338 stop:661 length:324 start_codon:yes stop_codon:yes gene_type:complete
MNKLLEQIQNLNYQDLKRVAAAMDKEETFFDEHIIATIAYMLEQLEDKIDDVYNIPLGVMIDTEINYCGFFNKAIRSDIKLLDKVVNLTLALEKAVENPFINNGESS